MSTALFPMLPEVALRVIGWLLIAEALRSKCHCELSVAMALTVAFSLETKYTLYTPQIISAYSSGGSTAFDGDSKRAWMKLNYVV